MQFVRQSFNHPYIWITSTLVQTSEKCRKNWGLNHSLFVDRQEEIQLTHKINDTFSSCSAVIALARLRAEQDCKWTKLEHRGEMEGWKKMCMTEYLWGRAEDISLLLFTCSERERRIHKSRSNIWGVVVAGRRKRSLGRKERDVEEDGGCLN